LREWAAERTPPFLPSWGERGAGEDRGITLTAPDPNTLIVLDPHLPRDAQRIEVAAQVQADAAHVEFEVDGQALASVASVPYRTWWVIHPGTHRIEAVAVMRNGTRIISEPVIIQVEDANGFES
jgi:hypothetical protein